jgi:hypothetical protein
MGGIMNIESYKVAFNILFEGNYIMVNKILIRKLGLHEAVLIGDTVSKHRYLVRDSKVGVYDYFTHKVADVKYNTGLSIKQQRSTFKHLANIGLIERKKTGVPARNMVKIDYDVLVAVLCSESVSPKGSDQSVQKGLTGESKRAPLVRPKQTDIYNNKDNIKNIRKKGSSFSGEDKMIGTSFDKHRDDRNDSLSFLRPPARAFNSPQEAGAPVGTITDCDAMFRWIVSGEFIEWDKMGESEFARLIIGIWRRHGFRDHKHTYKELQPKMKKYVPSLEDKETTAKMLIHLYDNLSKYSDGKDVSYIFTDKDCSVNPASVMNKTNLVNFISMYNRYHKKKVVKKDESDVIYYIMSNVKFKYACKITNKIEEDVKYYFEFILKRLKKAGVIDMLKYQLIKNPAKTLSGLDKKYLKGCDKLIKYLGV